MKAEVLIYIYGAVCISMIVFNIVYNLLLKGSEPRMQKRCRKMQSKMDKQLSVLQAGDNLEGGHLSYLRRSLCHVNNLMAFHRVFQENFRRNPKLYQEYLRQIRPAILYIAAVYRDKENMQAGYFTYFLSCYAAERQMPIDSLQDILLDYVKKPNLYCRFNAMKALYYFAGPESIAEAIKIQDDGCVFLHEKIITEGLLSYTGDHNRLIGIIWQQFPYYSVHTQLAILNYIRFRSGDYKGEMFALMKDEETDKELRLAAVRYFGKYQFEPARKHLLAFVRDKEGANWEFATVAASSLASYPGEDVVDALKEALHSANWYIRYSAAQSLEHLKVNYMDVFDIAVGSDRYAREMMMYRLESRKLQSLEV